MRKNLMTALALLSPLAAAPAFALDVGAPALNVFADGTLTSQMLVQNLVRQSNIDPNAPACVYTVKWETIPGTSPFLRSARCDLRELQTTFNSDCNVGNPASNAHQFFATYVTKADPGDPEAPSPTCRGIDSYGSISDVNLLSLGEDPAGHLFGATLMASIGGVQSIVISL